MRTLCKRENGTYPECTHLGCSLMSQNSGKVIRPIRIVRLYNVLNFNDSDERMIFPRFRFPILRLS